MKKLCSQRSGHFTEVSEHVPRRSVSSVSSARLGPPFSHTLSALPGKTEASVQAHIQVMALVLGRAAPLLQASVLPTRPPWVLLTVANSRGSLRTLSSSEAACLNIGRKRCFTNRRAEGRQCWEVSGGDPACCHPEAKACPLWQFSALMPTALTWVLENHWRLSPLPRDSREGAGHRCIL